jgi:trehalose/maltose hydrolase-like predicted phosphorylase
VGADLGMVAQMSVWNTVAEGLTKTMPFDSSQQVYKEFDGYNGDQIKQADVVMLTYPLRFAISTNVALSDLNYYARGRIRSARR